MLDSCLLRAGCCSRVDVCGPALTADALLSQQTLNGGYDIPTSTANLENPAQLTAVRCCTHCPVQGIVYEQPSPSESWCTLRPYGYSKSVHKRKGVLQRQCVQRSCSKGVLGNPSNTPS